MKNGVNVSAISELVHEIKDCPEEGDAFYKVTSAWKAHYGMKCNISVNTMEFGSKRHARKFSFAVDLPTTGNANGDEPTPQDYLITALASCAMTVIVQANSYKSQSITNLKIDAKASRYAVTDKISKKNIELNMHLNSEGDKNDRQEFLNKVRSFSPNFVTITQSTPIKIIEDNHIKTIDYQLLSGKNHSFSNGDWQCNSVLKWRYAVQMDAMILSVEKNNSNTDSTKLIFVDQPSIVGGLDESPNPQEYLLGAIASDITKNLLLLAKESDLSWRKFSVDVSGHIDMRGLLNVGEDATIKVQDITCHLRNEDVSRAQCLSLLERAIFESEICQIILSPCDITLCDI